MLARRIEEVSLNAWPALQQMLFDGWILRFSKGYTKRANSVNPLFGSTMDVDQKVDACQALYAERGLRPIFRLTPFSVPSGLDQVLEDRDYTKTDPTLVLHLDLQGFDPQPAAPIDLRGEPLDAWLGIFCRFKGAPIEKHRAHREILQAIPSRRFPASLVEAGRPVACGLGVLENEYFGLFDVVTDPQHRRQGYGRQLVASLLRRAKEHGARHAYLQVESTNEPARRLYAGFGFQEIYRYWYRIAKA
jgi:ribosomal protein S18 acetylase RimI-like enzyme